MDVTRVTTTPVATVGRFFKNYELIPTQGFDSFEKAQAPLLAPDLVTVVNNFGTPQTYQGPQGYFKSLGDWSGFFATGPDFAVHLPQAPKADGSLQAALSGTLTLTRDGKTTSVPPSGHHWTETFQLNPQGQIQRLTVEMNLQA